MLLLQSAFIFYFISWSAPSEKLSSPLHSRIIRVNVTRRSWCSAERKNIRGEHGYVQPIQLWQRTPSRTHELLLHSRLEHWRVAEVGQLLGTVTSRSAHIHHSLFHHYRGHFNFFWDEQYRTSFLLPSWSTPLPSADFLLMILRFYVIFYFLFCDF